MNRLTVLCVMTLLVIVCCYAKSQDNKTSANVEHKFGSKNKIIARIFELNNGGSLVFIEELKYLMERHLLGICPQPYMLKMAPNNKARNITSTSCESDADAEMSGRLASLSLRAHSASRSSECWRLGSALANMLGELARTAAQVQSANASAAASAEAKKRKLSKSQKAKIQAKQKTALAVKKKAAAAAAAAAARVTL